MTTRESERADRWDPTPRLYTFMGYGLFVVWTVIQPVLDEALLREPFGIGLTQWIVGCVIIFAAVLVGRYRAAEPYRAVVAAARLEHPDSLVFGIRLDPLTTPVGAEWGDSRRIRWGLIEGAPNGLRVVRSDGFVMLDRVWSEIEFTCRGMDVRSETGVEEWWFLLLSESGIRPVVLALGQGRRRLEQLQALRSAAVADSDR